MTKQGSKVFSLPVINWLISIIVGCVIPVLTQTLVAVSISSLDTSTVPTQQTEIYPSWLALTILLSIFFIFEISFCYLIWFIVKLKTNSSVWALIVFTVSPPIIWVVFFLLAGIG